MFDDLRWWKFQCGPCLCGSGLPFSLCCQNAFGVSMLEWLGRREMAGRLTKAIVDFAHEKWGARLLVEGWSRFSFGGSRVGDLNPHWPMFEPWLAFWYTPAEPGWDQMFGLPSDWPSTTLARAWLESVPNPGAEERRFVDLACASPWSLLGIEEVWPDWKVEVRDLLTGRRFTVVAPEVAGRAQVDDIVAGAVLTDEGITTFLGAGTQLMSPGFRVEAFDLRRDACGDGRWLTYEELCQEDDTVFEKYRKACARRGPLDLLERFRDAFEPFHLRWRVSMPFMEAVERLQSLTAAYGQPHTVQIEVSPDGTPDAFLPWYVHGEDVGDTDSRQEIGHLFLRVLQGQDAASEACYLTADVPTHLLARRVTDKVAARLGAAAVLLETRRDEVLGVCRT